MPGESMTAEDKINWWVEERGAQEVVNLGHVLNDLFAVIDHFSVSLFRWVKDRELLSSTSTLTDTKFDYEAWAVRELRRIARLKRVEGERLQERATACLQIANAFDAAIKMKEADPELVLVPRVTFEETNE